MILFLCFCNKIARKKIIISDKKDMLLWKYANHPEFLLKIAQTKMQMLALRPKNYILHL